MIDFDNINNDFLEYQKVVKQMISLNNINSLISILFSLTISPFLLIFISDFTDFHFEGIMHFTLSDLITLSIIIPTVFFLSEFLPTLTKTFNLLSFYNKKALQELSNFGFNIYYINKLGFLKNKDIIDLTNSFINLPKSSQNLLNSKQYLFFNKRVKEKSLHNHFEFFKNSILDKKITLLDIEYAHQYCSDNKDSLISEKYIFHLIESYLKSISIEDTIKNKFKILHLIETSIKDTLCLEELLSRIEYNTNNRSTRKKNIDQKIEKIKQTQIKTNFIIKSI